MKQFLFNTIFFIKRFFIYAGPAYLVAVGYMDPGNWVTDLAGGSRFNYSLLSIILLSNFMAIILQYCALKLGIVTGKDLARACRDYYPSFISRGLWILAEFAVIATDIAEVIGSALGLYLLCGIPLIFGVVITIADVLFLLAFGQRSMRSIELLVTFLVGALMACFGIIIYLSRPDWYAVFNGFIPTVNILSDPDMLYLAIGIIGATVMPHNLYLHSYLVKRSASKNDEQKSDSIFYSAIDLCVALSFAFLVNAAILIVAASVFYKKQIYVVEIQEAYNLFTPLLQTPVAGFVFALALLIAGQNSTLTGTLAGQIIMDGFINVKLAPWKRRFIGRCISIVPALGCILFFGEGFLSQLLIISQIILSFQLPFAIFPLIHFTGDPVIMGKFANSRFIKISAYTIAFIIVSVNLLLIAQMIA